MTPVNCPLQRTVSAERQSAWMSKITNDSLTRSGTRCFAAAPFMATVGIKRLMVEK